MDDVIYRKDAIRVLNAKCKKAFNLTCGEEDCACTEYTALRDLPSAQQWIPCSERLPDSQEDVLCDDDGSVTIGYYTDEEIGWHDTHSYRIYPTAWMPLPEPYKRKTDG